VRVGKAAHRPQHIAARQAERSEGIGASQGDDLALLRPDRRHRSPDRDKARAALDHALASSSARPVT